MALRTISGRYRDLDKVGYNVADICCPSGRLIRSVSDCAWNENASTLSTRRDPHQRSGTTDRDESDRESGSFFFSFLFFSFFSFVPRYEHPIRFVL